MDNLDVARIVESDMTVSDKIRALAGVGYPRAEIARLLGKRYQHVRNVLEGDKLKPRGGQKVEAQSGFAESPQDFKRSYRLSVEPAGVVRLPPELLAALEVGPGSVIIAEPQEDGVKLFSTSAAWGRARASFQRLGINPRRDLVAALIAERRAGVAREDRDD